MNTTKSTSTKAEYMLKSMHEIVATRRKHHQNDESHDCHVDVCYCIQYLNVYLICSMATLDVPLL